MSSRKMLKRNLEITFLTLQTKMARPGTNMPKNPQNKKRKKTPNSNSNSSKKPI